MGREGYVVRLTRGEREQLESLMRGGRVPVRQVTRARILLKADEGWGSGRIVQALDVSPGTVCRTKRRYVEGGMRRALEEEARPGRPPKLDARGEAHLVALACSEAPEGHDHWTLRLLAQRTVELGIVPSMSHEGIRKRLKKTASSHGRRRSGVFPR